MITILLLAAVIVLLCLYLKDKYYLEKLKKHSKELENQLRKNTATEFSVTADLPAEETSSVPMASDFLTGLPGRQAFDDRLAQTLNQSKRFELSFAILLLDINEFHIINEAEGYEAGDKLLKEISARLQRVIRQIDTMIRYAGDKFAFLLPQLATPETAAYVAQRLLDAVVQPFKINDRDIYITANVGVSIFPADGSDADILLKSASDALHQAKIFGKSRYQFYQQDIHTLSEQELKISEFLSSPDILQKLLIEYRPYTHIHNGKIICVEALPYFVLPEVGVVTFKEFAKIAENGGKLPLISEWLLKSAINQFLKWQELAIKPESLILNVTLRQIKNPQFIYNVAKLLQDFKMDSKQVIFEINEKNVLANANSLEKAFTMLSHLNLQIGLSIFILGHFALQKMTQLPVHYLKIEGKIYQEKKSRQENEVILHMIVTLAKEANIKIIADGVDTEMQKDALQAFGCEVMQGKLFNEPLPVE